MLVPGNHRAAQPTISASVQPCAVLKVQVFGVWLGEGRGWTAGYSPISSHSNQTGCFILYHSSTRRMASVFSLGITR